MLEDRAAVLPLPTLRDVVIQHGLLAKKSLGQNFLLDRGVVQRVARVAGDIGNCTVIEIGPGPGGLTRALLENNAKRVIVIEKDSRCLEILVDIQAVSEDRLTIIPGDALAVKPQDLADGPLKIVANLPYNIGTVLLTQWLEDLSRIESMTLMFQKEVALRIVAKPGTKQYGRLSILTQWLCTVRRVFDLAPRLFTPPPKVVSSVVEFIPKEIPAEERAFIPILSRITHDAFGQRRKMIRSSLKRIFTESELESFGLNPTLRAENLTVSDYVMLARRLREAKGE